MVTFKILLQTAIALGILNVWLRRFAQPTAWRGASARNMKQEFAAYGLSEGVMYGVGFLKVFSALLLLVGLWVPVVTRPAAGVIAALMSGAVALHFKIGDAPKKALPAATLLLGCLLVVML